MNEVTRMELILAIIAVAAFAVAAMTAFGVIL
jgi:hypothetical protein